MARPVTADPQVLSAYFSQVASYEASERARDRKAARIGYTIGAIGAIIGVLGVGAVAFMTPLKTVIPIVFRVDKESGAVERVYDVRGGGMEPSEAEKRYFLWEYVRRRQTYTAAEAKSNFESVALMSSPPVQQEYAAIFKGTNPNSPQVLLGSDGAATVRWVSTSFLGPQLAQIRFIQSASKGGHALPSQRMVATLQFEVAPGELTSSQINVNPLGIIVTSYRADTESTQ
jgi:type IV secretion system protein VirB8